MSEALQKERKHLLSAIELLRGKEDLTQEVRHDLALLLRDVAHAAKPKTITILRDGVNEDIAVLVDGEKVTDCKAYETDHWVPTIVEALGGKHEQVVDHDRLWALLEGS